MKEKCPVCGYLVDEGATKCRNCGFDDKLGINRVWLNPEDANHWFEVVVKPYRVQWEAWKRVAELSVQLDEERKRVVELLEQIEEYRKKERDISSQLAAARKNEDRLSTELEQMRAKKGYSGMADTTPSKENPYKDSSCEIVNDGLVAMQGDWLYYCCKNLYKIRTDGAGRQKLNDDWCTDINVAGDWVYYCNMNDNDKLFGNSKFLGVANSILQISGKLYKIRTDGTGRQKLSDDWCTEINVRDDWLYYTNMNDNLKHYRMMTDGTNRQLVG
jgi:hypothetical protein